MLKHVLLAFTLLFALTLGAQASFPTPELTTVDRETVALSDYVGQGKPTVIAIWATWCQPCHMELDHMKAFLKKWEDDYGATVLAVSVDKPHMINRIKPLVKRKGWKYDILIDPQGQLQQTLGFRSIPQMYVLDGDGKIVRTFSGYANGREKEVDKVIRRLAK